MIGPSPAAEGMPTSHRRSRAAVSAAGAPIRNQPAARLIYGLRTLPLAAAVLQVGAHPDDEDTGMLVTMSRRVGARAVYWSATRGEGGQNKRGPEMEEALGVVRTWESLQARELDGGEVLYGPFYDYGFSKRGEDTLAHWGREDLIREIVRAIRIVQPLVVISRWNGGSTDGHGHHQAIGLVADEAFDAAADPARFPELADQGLVPWRASKLYHSVAGDWQPGEASHFGEIVEEYEQAGYLRVATGELDPVSGLTFQEQAHLAVNRHRSQGMGFIAAPGPYYYYYRLVRRLGDETGPETSFFDGLDPYLTGLADYPGEGSAALREGLERACGAAERAIEAFHPERPSEAGRLAAEGAGILQELRAEAVAEPLESDAAAALDTCLAGKTQAFEELAAACLGLRVDCLVDPVRTTPGRAVNVCARLWNGGDQDAEINSVELDVPEGWALREQERTDGAGPSAGATTPYACSYEVTPPPDASPSVPYWLRRPRKTPYRYEWAEDGALGNALDPPLVSTLFDVSVGPHRLRLHAPAMHTSAFAGGFRRLPLAVLPPIAVAPRQRRRLLPVTDHDRMLPLVATVHCIEHDGADATVSVRAPNGWAVEPPATNVRFSTGGETHTLRAEVTIPAGTAAGTYELAYEVDCDGRESGFDLDVVRLPAEGVQGAADESNCAAEAFHVQPATIVFDLVGVEFARDLSVAYVEGMKEEILASLEGFDLDVTGLSDDDLAFGDLGRFDAVVVGPNAYNAREALRQNASRLLAYASDGGTLVVQYQTYGYDQPGLAPYPFGYHQPHDRVTLPESPVELLEPAHPALQSPNRLTAADFDGWVHDRGLYFFGEWDARYKPLLASADPGEQPKSGGLLVAQYGRGTYAYVAYSLFRQIPAGVRGGIGLFANLIGLAEARLRTRIQLLRRLALMDTFSDEELQGAAHAMAEHTIPAGEYLMRQGERGTDLFVLVEGTLEVLDERTTPERVLNVVEPVESVGELAALGRLPHSASLRAKTDATVLVLSEEGLADWLRGHPELGPRLIARITSRLMDSGELPR
ncbi:MAG TPA: cyclic nucleotide-binding domain-containing protein [Gaiellaceae bacterium]